MVAKPLAGEVDGQGSHRRFIRQHRGVMKREMESLLHGHISRGNREGKGFHFVISRRF